MATTLRGIVYSRISTRCPRARRNVPGYPRTCFLGIRVGANGWMLVESIKDTVAIGRLSPELYEPAQTFVVASKVCDLPTVDAIVINDNAQPRTYTGCVRWASRRNMALQVYRG